MCDCESKPRLTEADVRRIVREAVSEALGQVADRVIYAGHSGLRVNGVPVHEN